MTTVAVGDDDTLDEALGRLRLAATDGQPIDLVIPAGSALFLTAAEFRSLKDAADRGRLAVTIRAADPLRLQLARSLGLDASMVAAEPAVPRSAPPPSVTALPAAEPPGPAVTATATIRAAAPAAPTDGRDRGPAVPLPAAAAASPPTTSAPPGTPTAGNDDHPTEVAADTAVGNGHNEPSYVALWPEPPLPVARTPAPVRRLSFGPLPAGLARVRAAALAARPRRFPFPSGDEHADSDAGTGAPRLTERIRTRPRLALVGAAIAAVALVALVVVLLLSRAEVAVVLRQTPVRAEVTFDVVAPGAPTGDGAVLTVVAKSVTIEVEVEQTVPTTGTRTEPNGTASGRIRLANPLPEAVTVEAGTVVATEEGVEFAFAEDVAVPPADPATGRPGAAEGKLLAVKPGAIGNVEPGEIGGRLPNGVYYMNRDGPTTGGTERTIRTVAPEDLDSLRARVLADLPNLAAAAYARELPAGTVALPSTFTVGDGTDAFDHAAGDDAESLTLRAVRTVTALTYAPDQAQAQAETTLTERLRAQTPPGFAVDVDTLRIEPPEPIGERNGRTRFRLVAAAQATAVLDEDERQALAQALAGKEPAAVESILRDVPEIERFDVAFHPRWLPDRMPDDADRIAIEARE